MFKGCIILIQNCRVKTYKHSRLIPLQLNGIKL